MVVTLYLDDETSDGETDSIAEASISQTYYDTVSEALNAAQSGDVVRILTNCTIDTDVSIPAGVTLLIPYSSTDTDGHELGNRVVNDDVTSRKIAGDGYLYLTITISPGTNVDVYGSLIVGGITGRFFTFDYQGHTSDDFSKVILNGTLTVKSGGIVQCYGFIKGSGSLSAMSGSSVYEPFVVTDFVGGDNAYNLFKSGQSPFNRYSIMNVQCTMTINGGSFLYGYANLYADGKYNETTVCIVGNNSGLFVTNNDSCITFTYNANKYVKAEWESNIWNDIGKTTIYISGGATFGSMTFSASGSSIDTRDCVFSFPYNMDIILDNGNYDMTYSYRVLPGSEITVSKNATLNVNGSLYVYDGLTDREFRDKYYPTTNQLQSYDFDTCGRLIVNGTLDISSGATFVGTIESKIIGAKIIVSSNAIIGECTVKYGCNYRASGVSSTTISETSRVLSAMIFDENGNKTSIIAGKTYTSDSIDTSTNTSYTYTNTSTGSSYTVTVDQTISGEWTYITDKSSSALTITSSAGAGGSISPSGAKIVNYGSNQTYIITSNNNYVVSDVIVDGSSVGAVYSYTFTNVTGNHTINAIFKYSEGTKTWTDPSTGYVYQETKTTVGDTDCMVLVSISPSGDKSTTATYVNDVLGIDTVVEADGSFNVNTHAAAVSSGKVDQAVVTDDQLNEILKQIDLAESSTGAENPTINVVVTGSGSSDVESTSLTLTGDLLTTIGGLGIPMNINTETGSLNLDSDVIKKLSTYGGDLAIAIGTVENSELNDNQRKIVGDRTVISANVSSGTTIIHDLGGNVTVTMPYELKDGEKSSDIVIWYLDDSGNVTEIHATYNETTKTVSFTTAHFSYYVIAFSSPSQGSSDYTWLYVAIAIIAIAMICIVAYYIRTKRNA